MFGEGKDLVPALFAELVEEFRAGNVGIVLEAGFELLLPELLHKRLLQLARRGKQLGQRKDLT